MNHDAIVNLRAALEFAPQNINMRLMLAQTLMNEKMPHEAETEYKAILEIAPYSTEAKFGLAKVCVELDKKEIVSLILTEICKEEKTKPEYHILFAKQLLTENKKEDAFAQYEKAASLEGFSADPELETVFASCKRS